MSSEKKVFDFMSKRYIAGGISIVLLVVSIGALFVNGINFGLDFTHGTLVELHYADSADLPKIRKVLKEEGYENAVVAKFGSDRDVVVRVQSTDPAMGDALFATLRSASEQVVTLKRVEFVGPQIGEELRDQGGIGMLTALLVVMCYVALRFQFKFSVGAVAALIHDVIIVLGIFSLFKIDFDLTVLAAVLAVIGYSLNDTIVVSDRIRENFRLMRKGSSTEVINTSLTQTFSRTIITSVTTLLVLLSLFFVGGEAIHNFSVALIIGVVIGTYSSIYVAANVLLLMNITKEDLMPVEKEGADLDDLELP